MQLKRLLIVKARVPFTTGRIRPDKVVLSALALQLLRRNAGNLKTIRVNPSLQSDREKKIGSGKCQYRG